MKIVNLTPHAINFMNSNNEVARTIEPSGKVTRVSSLTEPTGECICDIPITKNTYGQVENLPDPERGTIYIVSLFTCTAAQKRADLYIVNETVRDANGRIIGCRSLAQNPNL